MKFYARLLFISMLCLITAGGIANATTRLNLEFAASNFSPTPVVQDPVSGSASVFYDETLVPSTGPFVFDDLVPDSVDLIINGFAYTTANTAFDIGFSEGIMLNNVNSA